MTFEEFEKEINKLDHVYIDRRKALCYGWNRSPDPNPEMGIYIEWVVGGQSGGHCGGGDLYRLGTEPEPDWVGLDEILERLAPNISFIQFRRLLNESLVENYTSDGYYGNYTDYSYRWLSVRKLYDYLIEKGVLLENVPDSDDLRSSSKW